ncbi:hypothetical protein ES675_03925 [Bizionia algoritergicola]|uniref:Uncharacterized protein n=1 Tax=Bizionia algoritergicola TaxID=291187 RepID=A0A5D0R403_9FLAO|nr:hypothetical protein ES675_03925 [Bizionia algoritergicola]
MRQSYKEAAQSQELVDAFYKSMQIVSKTDAMALVAYKGAAIALKARSAKTLKEKKDGFIEGIGYLEYAIETEPNNIEPRFVRLGIQENTPKILKYKDAIEDDKQFILKQYHYISSSNLKNHIKDFILQSTVFTDEEKQTITSN